MSGQFETTCVVRVQVARNFGNGVTVHFVVLWRAVGHRTDLCSVSGIRPRSQTAGELPSRSDAVPSPGTLTCIHLPGPTPGEDFGR
ncbi:hypothetical protein GCM10009609_20670 [Pseudonocardia aurantiaca]